VSDRAQTFLDKGTRFEGRILVNGTMRLDGYFKGDGKAQGTLVIGESGEVEAELEVDRLVINGTFTGNVRAKERVEIGATGRVHGTLTTPILKVDDGALLSAEIQMGEAARRDISPAKSAERAAPKAEAAKAQSTPAPESPAPEAEAKPREASADEASRGKKEGGRSFGDLMRGTKPR